MSQRFGNELLYLLPTGTVISGSQEWTLVSWCRRFAEELDILGDKSVAEDYRNHCCDRMNALVRAGMPRQIAERLVLAEVLEDLGHPSMAARHHYRNSQKSYLELGDDYLRRPELAHFFFGQGRVLASPVALSRRNLTLSGRPSPSELSSSQTLANPLSETNRRARRDELILERRSSAALKDTIGDILGEVHMRGRTRSKRSAAYIKNIAARDYGAAIKNHFDRRELRQIYAEIRRTLPALNREVFRTTDLSRLAAVAEKMGVVLQAFAFRGKRGRGVGFRGFYVNEREVLKRPLIWINTAAHPTAVAAAFWHEVGHHLTNQIWKIKHAAMSTSLGASYGDHLSDPREIAADMVRALACYPKSAARRLFGGPDTESISRDVDLLLTRVRPYLRDVLGLDFGSSFSVRERLCLLGDVIHVAKLRAALLTEYGI